MSVPPLAVGDGGADSSAAVTEDLFPELLERLRLSHDTAVQGLQLKVTRLRKERCFDAQKVEEVYKKNQKLREQQKVLQESVRVLQNRVKCGPCERCTQKPTENHGTQTTFQNHITLQMVQELECERDQIKEENRKLKLELEHLRRWSSLSEAEEGVIPDSPQQPLSFPVVNKMKKRKRERRRVCYAEIPIGVDVKSEAGTVPECDVRGVLVPDTCDLDIPGVPGRAAEVPALGAVGAESLSRVVVAETCALDVSCEQDSDADPPDAAGRGDDSGWGTGGVEGTMTQQSRGCVSPAAAAEPKQPPHMDRPDDQSWSLDPGADLSQYRVHTPEVPQALHKHTGASCSQPVDPDLTYVSHSLLMLDQDHTPVTGIGQRANDSLANMFDYTGAEEYQSCPQEEEEEEELIHDPSRTSPRDRRASSRDAVERSVACVMVVRKKAERRKLHGHTCKECETFYADLPESERKKKLSSCSRHRFRFIPPSTPENFWEVGFPSTQTCRDRGYVKEDEQPGTHRRRRRMPYLATFSPQSKGEPP